MAFAAVYTARCELQGGLALERGPFDTYEDAEEAAIEDEIPVSYDAEGEEVLGDPIPVVAYSITKRNVRAD